MAPYYSTYHHLPTPKNVPSFRTKYSQSLSSISVSHFDRTSFGREDVGAAIPKLHQAVSNIAALPRHVRVSTPLTLHKNYLLCRPSLPFELLVTALPPCHLIVVVTYHWTESKLPLTLVPALVAGAGGTPVRSSCGPRSDS
jgi:hypothetical protein